MTSWYPVLLGVGCGAVLIGGVCLSDWWATRRTPKAHKSSIILFTSGGCYSNQSLSAYELARVAEMLQNMTQRSIQYSKPQDRN